MNLIRRSTRSACALAVLALISAPTLPITTRGAEPSRRAPSSQIDYYLRDYTLFTLDPATAAREVRGSGWLTIEAGAETISVALGKRDLRGREFREEVTLGDGSSKRQAAREAKTFAGVVPAMNGAAARFSVDDLKVTGMILADGEAYFVEPLANYALDALPTDYVFYRASDVNPNAEAGTCAATEAERVTSAAARVAPATRTEPALGKTVQNSVVQIATEADNEYVQAYGSTTAANDEIVAILNQVEAVYQNEVGITFEIVYQHAWETNVADPYTSSDAGTLLSQFRSHWNASFASVSRDFTHMFTGRDFNGSTIGIAYVGVVCNSPSYAYGISQRWTSSPQRYILTAHEIGHNFNACHSDTSCNPNTSSCTNTIMSSAVGTGFTFCQFSRDQIGAHTSANSSCLSSTTAGTVPTTIGLYAPATGTFFLKNSNVAGNADLVFPYGPANATPLVGDWDANGTETAGVYIPSTGAFFLRNSNSSGSANVTFVYGPAGAVPIAGDWDANGTTTVGIFVPATSTFFLRNSNSAGAANVTVSFGVGGTGWTPIVGDWDGDGDDTIGLYNPTNGTFFLKNSNTPGPADITFVFGPPFAAPVVGDWSGSGRDSVGVYIRMTAVYFLRNSNTPGPADITAIFGVPPITGIAGNWDGL